MRCRVDLDDRMRQTALRLIKRSSRFIGVADIAAVRFSLPANLLEPIPNLGAWKSGNLIPARGLELLSLTFRAEYWHYLDRPEFFARWARFHIFILDGAHRCD